MTNPHSITQSRSDQEPVIAALSSPNPQQRLQAALSVGTTAEDRHLGALIQRCRTEPDFFVRDMLTWAITRMPAEATVPLLHRRAELQGTAGPEPGPSHAVEDR